MDETNELIIPIGADPSGLREGFNEAERIVRSTTQRIEQMTSRIGDIGRQLAGLGASLTASLTLPIVAFGTAAVNAYGDIQALQKGLEAVLGSADKAIREFERLKEVAKLPGLGLEEAVKGSINLQSIGLSAKTSRNILLQFGNAVATVGKGRAEFERAVYGVQQLANTDFPLGEDLNIIKDAVPQVSRLLKEAFGTSRSDDLQKLKISSKQVLDVILDGLGKLPRVSGGIKGAFENLGDSMKTSLGRIGKIIDDTFDISGIVDRITEFTDKVVTKFESLDPVIQKVILVVAGLVAGIGPLLVALGGFLALVPAIVSGITAIGSAFTFMTGPIGLVTIAILGVVAAVVANWDKIKPYLDETIDRFKRLYNESTIFRTAVGSLGASLEAIFKGLLEGVSMLYNNFKVFGKGVLEIMSGVGEAIEGVLTLDPSKVKSGLLRGLTAVNDASIKFLRNSSASAVELFKIIDETGKKYQNFRFDLNDTSGIKAGASGAFTGLASILDNDKDNLIKGLDKTKNEVEKQLSEIIPAGSIADYRKRAELLKKSIEYSVDGLVKVRGLDKFGKDIDKKGNPYYTGLVLPIEQAYEELEKLQVAGGELDLQAIKIKPSLLLDGFGNEFKSVNDLLASESARTYKVLNESLPLAFTDGAKKMAEAVKAAKIEEIFKKANESIKNIIEESTVDGINNLFDSLGQALANGGNIIQAIGQSILSTLGSFISKFGAELVKTALLSEVFGGLIIAIKNAFGNPYVLLALGAAAVAVGAAVSASAKRTSSTASGNFSSASGVNSGNNYSANYTSGGGFGSNRIELFVDGRNLVRVLNNNLSEQDRLNAG